MMAAGIDECRREMGPIGSFVRGFLVAGEAAGLELAVLHGWEDGFESGLGDVDMVVGEAAFPRVVAEVARHAGGCGWRLCQVLRHESTAVFCVLSQVRNPAVVVALDVCSDYRRGERVLMKCGELLVDRQPLEGGGFRVSRANELRYRFLKAAVKGKDPEVVGAALAAFPERERSDLAAWLTERWGIDLRGWDAVSLKGAWNELGRRTLEQRRSGMAGGWRRIGRRLVEPTGLVIEGMDEARLAAVLEVFGRLYFRRVMTVGSFHPTHFKALVCSTLVTCDRAGPAGRAVLGRDLRLVADRAEAPEELVERIARHLEQRCARREGLLTGG